MIERYAEVVRTQNGKVGIIGFQILIGMSVDNRQIVVVIFLCHKTARVLTERTHFILKGLGISNEFGFIQNVIDFFHDFISDFHTDTYIHRAGLMGNVVLGTNFFQPVRPSAAGCHHGFACVNF